MIGHNPKANQHRDDFLADDFQDVAALLRELPRVTAPTDFNASLKARIAAAKADAHEFADVTALVKELPRVAAPADFDFKLRARIAQAKAKQEKSSAGWFAEWFGRTFSWAQASAAMAAVAIVISVITFGVLRSDKVENTTDTTTIAKVERPTSTVAPTAPSSVPDAPQAVTPIIPDTASISPTPVKLRTIKNATPTNLRSLPLSVGEREILPPPSAPATLVATKVMIKHQSGEARMVNLSEYNLGLQTAHLRSTPASPPTVQTAMANIY